MNGRSNRWLPIVVIVVVCLVVGGAAWWTVSNARSEAASEPDAAQFAAIMGRQQTTDQGCIDCHTDREALTADLDKNPVEEVVTSGESEGEG